MPSAFQPEFIAISSKILFKSQYYSELVLGHGAVGITQLSSSEKVMHKIFCAVLRETMAYFSQYFFFLFSFPLSVIKPFKWQLDVNLSDSDKDSTFSMLSLQLFPKRVVYFEVPLCAMWKLHIDKNIILYVHIKGTIGHSQFSQSTVATWPSIPNLSWKFIAYNIIDRLLKNIFIDL